MRDKNELEARYEVLRSAERCDHATAIDRLTREERRSLAGELALAVRRMRPGHGTRRLDRFTIEEAAKVIENYLSNSNPRGNP